jgi:protein transport protein SEC23
LNKGENSGIKKFLVPVSECEFAINTILDDLQPDPWEVKNMERSYRCVGTALNVGISLLEAASPG